MFTQSAPYYDAVYGFKDYRGESTRVASLIETRRGSPGGSLLDVACRTGAHLVRLRERFDVEGLDFHYLVGTPEGTESLVERHELGLFTLDEYEHEFEAAGLEPERLSEGLAGGGERGLLIGRRPTEPTAAR